MLDFPAILAMIASGLGLFGYGYYIRDILLNRIRPHPFSWLTWTITVSIIFAAQVMGGAGYGAWPTGITALSMAAIALISTLKFRRAKTSKFVTRSDWLWLVLSLAGVPLWLLLDGPLVSVIFLTAIDSLGYLPTFRKSRHFPREEQALNFALQGAKYLISLAALDVFDIVTALYPGAIALIHFVLVLWIVTHRQ